MYGDLAGRTQVFIAAELLGLFLAADLLRESPATKTAAIFCDSKPALCQLVRGERGPLLAQRTARSLLALQERGCDIVLQWLPSHVGIVGNEAADKLAKQAHSAETPLTDSASSFDSTRNNHLRERTHEHPDVRVAAGRPPPSTPATGFSCRERGLLLAMRTHSMSPAERSHRLRGASSPNCADCGVVETLSHRLCECPALGEARKRLVKRYRLVALPCVTLQALLHPTGYEDHRRSALVVLQNFLEDTSLTERPL
ncbi:hypothetical protein HPB51_020655 [Rhipicephalus microplus]|uniref:RNase H type-1 domain-containing protein n=1 Tax=Rhipicephalus microplus TaxID=6941 RepID=A0A9J6DPW0_RHIMP|nr:hypothetical protein HPB51_020655 [Rhipicephalus microplus]